MADTSTTETGHKSKFAAMFAKHKTWIIGGAVALLVVIYLAVRNANQNSAQQSNAQIAANGGIDPATGYLYGSPADLAAVGSANQGALSGSQGPVGPAGPPGPVGPSGAAGATGPAGIWSGPAVTPVASVPAKTGSVYYVKPGDNLSRIASNLRIPGGWETLYSWNKGVIGGNPNLIHPGQRLTINQ